MPRSRPNPPPPSSRAASQPAGILKLRGRDASALFGSPVRIEVLDHLKRGGPASIRELARRMGRPADSLYFHVKRMLRIGALREQERRPTGRRPEAIYSLAAAGFGVDPRDRSPHAVSAAASGARAVLRMAMRQFAAAQRDGDCIQDGPRRELLVARAKGWLKPSAQRELNRRVDDLLAFLREQSHDRRGPCHVLTLVLCPLVPPAGRRSSS